LPVTFMLDRGGLAGPDGPTHHGVFDLAYMRVFPNMVVMAPADEHDLTQMLDLALKHDTPCSIRYPKATLPAIKGERAPVEYGLGAAMALVLVVIGVTLSLIYLRIFNYGTLVSKPLIED